MQPGGHRFDPGQLHQKIRGWSIDRQLDTEVRVNRLIDSVFGLGVFLIPISAIGNWRRYTVTKLILKHQERIAKIERGIDPDAARRS